MPSAPLLVVLRSWRCSFTTNEEIKNMEWELNRRVCIKQTPCRAILGMCEAFRQNALRGMLHVSDRLVHDAEKMKLEQVYCNWPATLLLEALHALTPALSVTCTTKLIAPCLQARDQC